MQSPDRCDDILMEVLMNQPVTNNAEASNKQELRAVPPIAGDWLIGGKHTTCSPEAQRQMEQNILEQSIKSGSVHKNLQLSDNLAYRIVAEENLVDEKGVIFGRKYALVVEDKMSASLSKTHEMEVAFTFHQGMLNEGDLKILHVVTSEQVHCSKPHPLSPNEKI